MAASQGCREIKHFGILNAKTAAVCIELYSDGKLFIEKAVKAEFNAKNIFPKKLFSSTPINVGRQTKQIVFIQLITSYASQE